MKVLSLIDKHLEEVLCAVILPFIIVMFISLTLITYVPAITEALPRLLGMIE